VATEFIRSKLLFLPITVLASAGSPGHTRSFEEDELIRANGDFLWSRSIVVGSICM
jgi:hypothetical protein